MSERPSPYRIGVCALIALYSDPNSRLNDVLGLGDLYNTGVGGSSAGVEEEDGTAKIATFIERSVIGSGQNATNTPLSLWLQDLCNIKRDSGVGPGVAEILLDTLQLAGESVDALIDLMDSLKGAVHHEGLVDADSVNGLYLRQVCLGFDELSFESVTLLWQNFHGEVTRANLDENSSNAHPVKAMQQTQTTQNPLAWDWPPSMEQLHEMLRRDCIDFQYESVNGRISTSRKRCSFEEMELYIRGILEKEPELPVAYFLRYLNCLRHGERAGALDALHQYFDHAMVQHAPAMVQSSRRRGSGGMSGAISSDILQFSAILLAMTHSTFGDSDLGLMATEEAVRVAQQSKDTACVAFALGWLYEHHGQGTVQRRELLERCASRASAAGISAAAASAQPGQPHHHHLHPQHQMSQAAQANAIRAQQLRPLVSGAHLALARHDLLEEAQTQSGGFTSIDSTTSESGGQFRSSAYARAWSNLLQVTAEPSAEPGTVDRPTHLTPHPSDTRSSMARQRLVSAAIWDAVGMPEISTWATKSTLSTLPKDLSYDDMVTAIQNISRLALHGTPSLSHNQSTQTAPGSRPHDMNLSGKPIRKPDSRPSCIYASAVSILTELRKELGIEGNELEEQLLHSLVLTLHEWAVNRMELNDARALQKALNSYLRPGLANYDQLSVDIKMQQCLFYCRIRDWDSAKTAAKNGLKISKRAGLVSHRVRFLLQTSLIHLESNQTNCSAALPSLLAALTTCEERDIHHLHAVGISILAQFFLRLCNPKRAISLLDASIPTLLQREHVWFQAEAYRTLAKAHMNVAVNAMKAEPEKAETIDASAMSTDETHAENGDASPPIPVVSRKRYRKALRALTMSEMLYKSCQDCIRLQEVLYLQSQIFDLLGEKKLCEASAERFLRVEKNLGGGFGDENINTGDLSSGRSNGDNGRIVISAIPILDSLHDPVQLEALVRRTIY